MLLISSIMLISLLVFGLCIYLDGDENEGYNNKYASHDWERSYHDEYSMYSWERNYYNEP